ncbi:MAG: DUF3576 domain-containing protein, partial [bacterium]
MTFRKTLNISFALILAACSNSHQKAEAPLSQEDKVKLGFGSLAGPEGITIGSKVSGRTESGGGQVVNRYLWQASLDTLSFAPIISSDGPGGMLIT